MSDEARMALSGQGSFVKRVIELGARWYVFIFMNVYGLGKITGGQFYRRGFLPEDVANSTLGEAAAYDLAWTFMGYSFAYILFIGIAEVLGGWLLLWERTKLIGVAILMPVMVNIVVFDIIFLDAYGALASATIYTLLLFVILACNGESVGRAFRALTSGRRPASATLGQRAKVTIAALVGMGMLFVCDQLLVNFFGHGAG